MTWPILEARADIYQKFRSLFEHWSFKKKCFWDLLTFTDDEKSKKNINSKKQIIRSSQRLSGLKTASQKRLRNWNTTLPDQMIKKVKTVNKSQPAVHKKEKNTSKNQVDQKCKQNVKTISDVLAKSQSQGTPFQQIQIGKYISTMKPLPSKLYENLL